MQILKEEIFPLISNSHDPKKAEVGKLYELRLSGGEAYAETPEYYVFDTRNNFAGRTWTPGNKNHCMVLDQQRHYTVVLVGDEIIRVTDSEPDWRIELIPLIE